MICAWIPLFRKLRLIFSEKSYIILKNNMIKQFVSDN